MALVMLVDEPLDVAGLTRAAESDAYGAVVTFAGNVRDNARGKRVVAIEYTSYRVLADSELKRIACEAETRWNGTAAVGHRLGPIAIGEATVFIAYGSAHRAEAFEACRWIIDTLKESVPIWKRETYEDGEVWIEGDQAIAVEKIASAGS
ncbi:MAG TPA: molybdenum cofactor biosynthesis protein MoaE [Capsulimonadaceae bacterium]|jgi:molybdopterin synthase catalytic subunit